MCLSPMLPIPSFSQAKRQTNHLIFHTHEENCLLNRQSPKRE